jgi:hypothetical protein
MAEKLVQHLRCTCGQDRSLNPHDFSIKSIQPGMKGEVRRRAAPLQLALRTSFQWCRPVGYLFS